VPQGKRRLELFGEDHNMRAGWVTVGKNITTSNFKPQVRECVSDWVKTVYLSYNYRKKIYISLFCYLAIFFTIFGFG
jgi:hypothetical protein